MTDSAALTPEPFVPMPFGCCAHCLCGTAHGVWVERHGHDDTCSKGCNDEPSATGECPSCGHWMHRHDSNGCTIVAGTAEWGGDAPCPCLTPADNAPSASGDEALS